MFKQEDCRKCVPVIGVIYENRSLFHELVILFTNDTDDGFQQGMSRTHEFSDRLLIDVALLKTDALVFLLDWRTGTDLSVALSDSHGDMG